MNTHRSLLLAAALGAAPSLVPAQEYHAIWGSGPNDLWIAGDGQALHYDGRAWTMTGLGNVTVRAIWGSGPADVWAVGDGGAILHWNGRAWSRSQAPVRADLVAVNGCSATEVYAIGQSDEVGRPPSLLRWNGQLWTADSLTVAFRVGGLAAGCGNVVVVGHAYFDPRPDQRRQAGVVARRRANAWTLTGWDGRRVTDSLIGNVAWTRVSVRGATTLLSGQREDGERVILLSAAAGWRRVPPPALGPDMTMPDDPLAFLTGDGSVIMLLGQSGFARYAAGRWTVTNPQAAMQQQVQQAMQGAPQLQPGRQPTQQEIIELAQRAQQAQQAMGDPATLASRLAALNFHSATAAWAPATGGDLYVLSTSGLVARVFGAEGTMVLDPTCLHPQLAAVTEQCQANPILQGTGAAPTPAAAPGRRPLPAPTRRNRP